MGVFDGLPDLVAAVEDYLERADLAYRIPTFVGLAERRLDRRLNLAENETALNLALVDGAAPLPDDFRAWRSVSGPCGERLDYLPPHVFAGRAREASYAYTGWDLIGGGFTVLGSISLEDVPDSTDAWQFGLDNPFLRVTPALPSVALVYRQGIPPLTVKRPSNWLLARHPDLYLYASLVEAAPFLRDDKRIATWKGLLDEALGDVAALDRDARWGRARIVATEPTP